MRIIYNKAYLDGVETVVAEATHISHWCSNILEETATKLSITLASGDVIIADFGDKKTCEELMVDVWARDHIDLRDIDVFDTDSPHDGEVKGD